MALTSGTRLGPYEILLPIGAGGMGEVYRARDTKLDREVAIKVLPDAFSTDAERLARFEREAKLLASLNHPNIASIHGFEESAGVSAIVLELVEGPTLGERIEQGPIPVDETLAIAKQIADALEAGHEAGVIHRDLKPANIKLKEDGTVKVLDYGLAKVFEGDTPTGADSELSQSPTLTRQGTQVGVILGTAAYMSPEQAKGKRVDRRADIWAFGAVVYEMLTGKRAFEGEDVSETLAHVLTKEPDWEALPLATPATLLRALHLCLAKNAKHRVRDIADVQLAVEGAFETTATSSPSASSGHHVGWPALGMALMLGSVLTGVVVWRMKAVVPRPLVRFVVNARSELPNLGAPDVDLAITPDGTRVVYRAVGGESALLVRALRDLAETSLGELGRATRGPFVSPDGNWVGYFTGNLLRKVSIRGGPPVTICELPAGAPRGASWGHDGAIVFATSQSTGLWRVSSGGGEPEELAMPDLELGGYQWPEILPGGDAVLYTVMSGPAAQNSQIGVLSLSAGETKLLVSAGSNPRYVPTGHIVYGLGGTLRAVGFDLERLEVTSDPVPVLEGVVTKDSGAVNFGVSENGSLAYISGISGEAARTLVWVDRDGREELIAAEPRSYRYPRISPDGTRLAVDMPDREDDIWIWDFARETLTRLTFDPARDIYATWTPDGARVAFASNRDGVMNMFWKAADGTGVVEKLVTSPNSQRPQTFSPDGTLVFREHHPQRVTDLGVGSMNGEKAFEPLLATEFDETNPDISPDGRWLAYESNESGQSEVYVRPFPDVDTGRWQISRDGGTRPLWAPDGRELFYLSPAGQLTAVSTETDPFAFGQPEVIIEQAYASPGSGRTYDISPDGTRFVMVKEGSHVSDDDPTQLILVQNWLEELKRLVPTQ